MIGYVTLGTNDLNRAARFYDALLAELGAKRGMEGDRFISWSVGPNQPGIGVIKPFDGQPATIGNGVMVAIACDTPDRVKALHTNAIKLGAADEGAPGTRFGNFYAAYFRDLDGNKLNVFCMTS